MDEPEKTENESSGSEVEPESDDWLMDNPEAQASVLRGIEDARAGRFGDDPRAS